MRPRLTPIAISAMPVIAALAAAMLADAPSRAQSPSPTAPGTAAPRAELAVAGPAVDVGGRLFTAPGVRFEPRLGGSASAVSRFELSQNGAAGAAALPSPWSPGEHVVAGTLFDLAGNPVALTPLTFTVDVEAPAVRWEVREPDVFEVRGEPKAAERNRRASHGERGSRRSHGDKAADSDLLWSADGRRWLPLAWKGKLGQDGSFGSFEVVSDRPQVFFRSAGPAIEADGKPVELASDQVLWLEAQDQGAGVARLSVRTRPAPQEGGAVLEIEAIDLVGNPTRLSWKLSA